MEESNAFFKQLRNPSYGLIPLFIFAVLIKYISFSYAIMAGISMSIIGVFLVKRTSRLLYDISVLTFAFGLLTNIGYPLLDTFNKFVLIEIIFVSALILARLTRAQTVARMMRNEMYGGKNYMVESFRVAFQVQYAFLVHLLIILWYGTIEGQRVFILNTDRLILITQLIIAVIIFLESIRLYMLSRKLRNEIWLPVVNEKGDVMGKIAQSVARGLKNKHLHPVVRIAVVHNGMLFLKNREDDRVLDPNKLDHPLEKYIHFKHDIIEAVQNLVKKELGIDNLPVHFLLKYVFENEETKRLIFLYVSVINEEKVFNDLKLKEGKLWTVAQIENNIGQGIFSESLELEFDYLKNTVLKKLCFKSIWGNAGHVIKRAKC